MIRLSAIFSALALFAFCSQAPSQPPKVKDDRLLIELVAKEPDIVTPTGIAVDEQGRVWIIENNTHERPADYKGPPSDRVRIFEDFDKEGHARKITTFAEGFKNAMSLALGKNGAVYLATRSDIYLLRDTKNQGKADVRKVIIKLDTPGDYPHNGLSGFAFDALGNMYFSLGENLGAKYKLIGSDRTAFEGGGEGGSIYRCRPDGGKLIRVATGFWNTFHLAVDAFGRLFAVDNDPDSRGPCRLLHIVQGGDYGYRFRNGRKGLHPFTAWNGELPGTLPMVAGTAEAPSGIVAYESTGLPEEYRGQLLVTSWGDHVVERFKLIPKGASFTAQAQVLVQGGEDFRPVGIAVGPDGSVYLSDWVDKSYPVHGKGRIWRIRMKQAPPDDELHPSKVAGLSVFHLAALLSHPIKEIRQAATEALAGQGDGAIAALSAVLSGEDNVRARIHALWAACRMNSAAATRLIDRALNDKAAEVRSEAAKALGSNALSEDASRNELHLLALAKKDPSPLVRTEAIEQLKSHGALEAIVPLLADKDPFIAGAALDALGRPRNSSLLLSRLQNADPPLRLGMLVALRRAGEAEGRAAIPKFLEDPDPAIRRAAIQWVGEERLQEYAKLLSDSASKPPVTKDLFEALLASQAFLSGAQLKNPSDEVGGEEFVAKVLEDSQQPAVFRALSLRMLRPDHPSLKAAKLKTLLSSTDKNLSAQALRTLSQRADDESQRLLRQLIQDEKASQEVRATAILGLAHSARTDETQKLLLQLLKQESLQRDVLRSLRGTAALDSPVGAGLYAWLGLVESVSASKETKEELAGQALLAFKASGVDEKNDRLKWVVSHAGKQPKSETEWKTVLDSGKGDPAAGERVFFHPSGPRCYACHRVDGRGAAIGPDLSTIARAISRDKLIESILTPSKEIAPRFTSWLITTRDGKTRTGVIVDEGWDSTVTVADSQGKLEVLKRLDIEDRQAVKTSLMPDNLHELMTKQEFRDLIAFLVERK